MSINQHFMVDREKILDSYQATDINRLSLEDAVQLLQLYKMDRTRQQMVIVGAELKERHKKIEELHHLLRLINKHTCQEEGEDRGKLFLNTAEAKEQHVLLAAKISKRVKRLSKQRDLYPDEELKALLIQAQRQGMLFENREHYQHQEIESLLLSARHFAQIEERERWEKVEDTVDLIERLQQAKEVYQIEFKWPLEQYNREERESLLSSIDMACKDLNLQNDLQMQELNRLYQERLEILQMAKSIMKNLHDDKINKARSVSGR